MSAIDRHLHQKYMMGFHFYASKSINELIYAIGNVQAIQFEDIKFLGDEVEYLRRGYRIKTMDGRAEIDDRIQAVAKYYHDNCMLTCQHPFMFITNTKELFLKRQKRLRQLKQVDSPQQPLKSPPSQNNQDSSNQTSSLQFQSSSINLPKSNFLDDLSLSFDLLMNQDQGNYLDINDELDSSVHDVFEGEGEKDKNWRLAVKQQNQQISKQFLTLDQSKVSHLVCDFQDVDIHEAINFYKEIVKSKNGSAIMSQILEEQQQNYSRKSSEKSKSKQNLNIRSPLPSTKPPLPKKSKESVLQSYISIYGSRQAKSKQKMKTYAKNGIENEEKQIKAKIWAQRYVDKLKGMGLRSVENEEELNEETRQRQRNKTKIRQKAEELLQKIKRQSFSIDLR